MMVHSLIPNRETLASQLEKLCRVCHADEVVLFERATFLVISNAVLRPHSDVHRFEKVSNIIKQFKLSCGKAQSQFQGMQVQNSRFTAYIDQFTVNTYIMVRRVLELNSMRMACYLLCFMSRRDTVFVRNCLISYFSIVLISVFILIENPNR